MVLAQQEKGLANGAAVGRHNIFVPLLRDGTARTGCKSIPAYLFHARADGCNFGLCPDFAVDCAGVQAGRGRAAAASCGACGSFPDCSCHVVVQ